MDQGEGRSGVRIARVVRRAHSVGEEGGVRALAGRGGPSVCADRYVRAAPISYLRAQGSLCFCCRSEGAAFGLSRPYVVCSMPL